MHVLETRIPTEAASRFLQQLCKHWSHKLDVTFTPSEGRVPFPSGGVCTLEATADTLTLRVEAAGAPEAERLATVVVEHLQRFAFRAPLEVPAWRVAAGT